MIVVEMTFDFGNGVAKVVPAKRPSTDMRVIFMVEKAIWMSCWKVIVDDVQSANE